MFDRQTGDPVIPTELGAPQKAEPRILYELPKGWKAKELTPSLKPPPRKGYDWSQAGHWG
ncbi:hypothetical protein Unana1_01383 [Umbelopsis nana]